ncbi:MAG TPA: hypothetical protein VN445_12810 [Rectinemataceae bacterium]|nr:hypothetical protein [Rectinemataceae bacterium]
MNLAAGPNVFTLTVAAEDGGYNYTFVGDGKPFVDVPATEDWDIRGHGTHTAGTIAALGSSYAGYSELDMLNQALGNDIMVGADYGMYRGDADYYYFVMP